MNTKTPDARLVPIREVAKITGLNPITLRAWERRYGLIEPVRTESGHRLYTPEHIEMLQEAIKLTEQGIPISQIKALLPEPKASLPERDGEIAAQLKATVQQQDLDRLNQQLDTLLADFPDDFWMETLINTHLMLRGEERPIVIFWESVLLPRLYSRLYLTQRHRKRRSGTPVWIQNLAPQEAVLKALVALQLEQAGRRPLLCSWTLQPDESAATQLEANRCADIAVISGASASDLQNAQAWQKWAEVHPDLSLQWFSLSGSEAPNETPNVHVTYLNTDAH
jgi:DNA-binding transcriptional MerR regulator